MTPILINMISLLANIQGGVNSNSLNSGMKPEDFRQLFHRLTASDQSSHFSCKSVGCADKSIEEPMHDSLLTSLRKKLGESGKSLDNMFVRPKDIHLLETILYQSGYSKRDVAPLVENLLSKFSGGEIRLSDFFKAVDALEPPERRDTLKPSLDDSSALEMEFILRAIGASSEQVQDILDSARLSDGRFLWERIIAGAKKHSKYLSRTIDSSAIPGLEQALKELGLSQSTIDQAIGRAKTDKNALDCRKFLSEIDRAISEKPFLIRSRDNNMDLDRIALEPEKTGIGRPALNPSSSITGRDQKTQEIPETGQGQLSIKEFISRIEYRTNRTSSTSPIAGNDADAVDRRIDQATESTQKINGDKTPVDRLLEKIVTHENTMGSGKDLQTLLKADMKDTLADVIEPGKTTPGKRSESGLSRFAEYGKDPFGKHTSGPIHKIGGLGDSEHTDRQSRHMETMAHRHSSDQTGMEVSHDISRSSFSATLSRMGRDTIQRPLPAYLIDQVSRQISRSLLKGQKELSLQIKPPEMGALKVQMTIHDQTLKLGIVAENSKTKELLLSNIPHLREALVEQGIKLDRIDVHVNDGFSQSLADFKGQSNEDQRQGLNGFHHLHHGDLDDIPDHTADEYSFETPGTFVSRHLRLDVMV